MGSIDGWVDPEIASMQEMIHGAIDASFEDRNRAKEGQLLSHRPEGLTGTLFSVFLRIACKLGSNSLGGTYYMGPKKSGSTCTFKIYALSARLELPRGATREDVMKAMKGHVLGEFRFPTSCCS